MFSESRCFSCNYAPSGYGYNGNRYAGAPQCALRKYEDANALDKWGCASGKCFVRMDKNGRKSRDLIIGIKTFWCSLITFMSKAPVPLGRMFFR